MVVDHYNPKDSMHFKRGEKVKITLPRSIHTLKRTATT